MLDKLPAEKKLPADCTKVQCTAKLDPGTCLHCSRRCRTHNAKGKATRLDAHPPYQPTLLQRVNETASFRMYANKICVYASIGIFHDVAWDNVTYLPVEWGVVATRGSSAFQEYKRYSFEIKLSFAHGTGPVTALGLGMTIRSVTRPSRKVGASSHRLTANM